jgi:hypothetical protein
MKEDWAEVALPNELYVILQVNQPDKTLVGAVGHTAGLIKMVYNDASRFERTMRCLEDADINFHTENTDAEYGLVVGMREMAKLPPFEYELRSPLDRGPSN